MQNSNSNIISIASVTTGIGEGSLPLIIDVMIHGSTEKKSFYFDNTLPSELSIYYPCDLIRWNANKEAPITAFSRLYHYLAGMNTKYRLLAHNPDFETTILSNMCKSVNYPTYTIEANFFTGITIDLQQIADFVNSLYCEIDPNCPKFFYDSDDSHRSSRYKDICRAYGIKAYEEKAMNQLVIYMRLLEEFKSDMKPASKCIHCGAKAVPYGTKTCFVCGSVC